MIVYLNGEFLPVEQARISPLDRGFIFGDGAYEVIPVYRREPFRLAQHLARLQHSLDGIRLANPHTAAQWEALVRGIVARQDFADQSVYFQVTRGVAKRDHVFPVDCSPTVFMMSSPLRTPTREQVRNGVAVVTAEDDRWQHCDLKTISLVGNVLLRQFAAEHDAIESVLFRDGYLTEASVSNVLIVERGRIVAPPRDRKILPGITFGAVEEIARAAGIPFEMRPITRAEAFAADEWWLTSSAKEVLAITSVDGRPFGGGVPGPMFRRMNALFDAAVGRA